MCHAIVLQCFPDFQNPIYAGLVTLALGVGEPGKEIQQPMAVVILGGIVSSTVLNMIVLPVLYLKYGREKSPVSAREYAPEGNLAAVRD